ncbi:MAG: serine/threonine-protein kinase [Gemmatimonadales bacterium]
MHGDGTTPATERRTPGGLHRTAEIPRPRYRDPASGLQGRVLDGRYAIEKRVGEGGMAYVYRATDLRTKQVVAIKVLMSKLVNDAESVARLRREAELATKLDHPNVCGLLAHGEANGLPYLVMPYLEGETLSVRENRIGKMPPREAIPILIQVCEGLQHAHDRGVLHRDLKPENVMLVKADGGERAVVMDFGLAKERIVGTELDRLTATGIVLGTPEFMSPEQIRGKPLDPRSDVYALGVLAFELLTTELPFTGSTAQETMLNHLAGRPRKLRSVDPALPASLERIIDKAIALDPAARFESLRAMGEALRSA